MPVSRVKALLEVSAASTFACFKRVPSSRGASYSFCRKRTYIGTCPDQRALPSFAMSCSSFVPRVSTPGSVRQNSRMHFSTSGLTLKYIP
jgi:hypothetical protein